MYSHNDRKSIIRDVQKFLLVIAEKNDIPHLSVDGFYSEETENAVRAFQRLYFLEATGKVNRETFDAIYAEYIRITGSAVSGADKFDNIVFPLKIGDKTNAVSVLNSYIRELSAFYKDLPLPFGDFYSKDTAKAIRLLQRYFREEENAEVSRELMDSIEKELQERQKFQNNLY